MPEKITRWSPSVGTPLYNAQTENARAILMALGVGSFNTTMIIPYLFMAPAQTDPDMAQVQLLVSFIQRRLNTLGARLPVTGRLDVPTVAALQRYTGPQWAKISWYEIAKILIAASQPLATVPPPSRGRAQAVGALPDLPLPDIPGGTLSWLLLGGAAYYLWKKRRSR